MKKNHILNLDELDYSKQTHGENFEAEFALVANKVGGLITKMACSNLLNKTQVLTIGTVKTKQS